MSDYPSNARAHQTRSLCALLSVLALSFTAVTGLANHYGSIASQRQASQVLIFMQGGLPALHARCIVETPRPEEIKDCIRLGTPNPGRSL